MLYVQGRWPLSSPVVALWGQPAAEDSEQAGGWLGAAAALGLTLLSTAAELPGAPWDGTALLVPYGLLLARQRLARPWRDAVQLGDATLISAVAVNAPLAEVNVAPLAALLSALADAHVILDPAITPPAAAGPCFALRLGAAPPPAGPKRLQANTRGLRQLARAVGIHATATATVQQERLC